MTRLTFRFPTTTTVTPLLTGDRLDLRFSRAADIDLAEVRADLPHFVRGVTRVSRPGQPLRLTLQLDPGTRQRHFGDGGRVVVDLLPPDASTASAAPSETLRTQTAQQLAVAAQTGAPAATPAYGGAPPTGNAAIRLTEDGTATTIAIRWASATRAAAFRRGEAIFILFDATGEISLRGIARAGRRHSDIENVNAPGVVGLRIPAAADVLVSARAEGALWTFTLSSRAEATATAPVRLDQQGGGRIIADFPHAGAVREVTDPEVGDRLIVALTPDSGVGVQMRRATIEASLLPSAQGAVIEPRADGVGAMFQNGSLIISRAAGLVMAQQRASGAGASDTAAVESALIATGDETDATATPLSAVREQLYLLQRRAAAEGVAEGAPNDARIALASFLVQNELAPEALGALRNAAINQPDVELDPEFRRLRAAANVMMFRVRDAAGDLSSSTLANDPTAALWRGYSAFLAENWTEARRELARGGGALEQLPPNWRARFALAMAESALELNDFDAAETAVRAAIGQATTQSIRLHARLVDARLIAARGQNAQALTILDQLARVRDEEVAVRASLEAVRLRRGMDQLPLQEAANRLEALRYRWRGDETEIETVSLLGDVYSEMHRWRDALTTMRVAADRFPNQPASRGLRADMQTLFTRLFLEDEASQLEPIQALGLFYEFDDLTPIGPDGDRIVRRLAGRLVAVDLLEQAATLLQHQVDERLEGVGRGQVASELAAIYLMDHRPEQALTVINATRIPNMPAATVAERRILEARAHLDLARLDHAVELVERDTSVDAQRVRAEAAWRARDWERASAELNTLLRMRGAATPMDAEWRQVVLRTAIAMTLNNDDAGVRTLYRAHAGDMTGTPDADAFEVVASGINADGAGVRDVARAVARSDLLGRFLGNIRTRMAGGAAPTTTAAAGAPARPTAAATPARPAAAAPAAAAPQRPTAQTTPAPATPARATPAA